MSTHTLSATGTVRRRLSCYWSRYPTLREHGQGRSPVGTSSLFERGGYSSQQNTTACQSGLRSRSRNESEVFGWSRAPNNTRNWSRCRIFLPDSDSPTGSFFTSHS